MLSIPVNLVPRSRRIARARAERTRRWAVGLAAYSLLLAAACGVAFAMSRTSGDTGESRLAAVSTEARDLDARVKALRAQAAALNSQLASARALGSHPDWSLLLEFLTSLRTDEISFDSVAIESSPTNKPGLPGSYSLHVEGIGKDHRTVAQFAVRLEKAGLFDRVVVADTRAVDQDRESRIAFRIDCTLSDKAKP
ncbi:MAG: hypothetical protein JSR77_12375 [Planctomycetes bacterium]|nr:hypothetical protein [Planctomycetota bacterium]